ncbi:MAG: hypothetical protein HY810_10065 [Candidatus Omnitrophica bacterium]|nr:hypothetical protein [Candidatus Omnitrophota bacterium]
MNFSDKYFMRFEFSRELISKNLTNALRDLKIAKEDCIREVKFNYAYTALIKTGITLLSYYQVKVRSVPGHHAKIIEKMAVILDDDSISNIANAMRSKRNLDLYSGGIEVSEKEVRAYIKFVENILLKVKVLLKKSQ